MIGPVHFIAHISIDDADDYRQYEKGFFPILKQHGGRSNSYDDDVTVLEGERAEGRTVVIQFESEAALLGWWNSPEYVELREAPSRQYDGALGDRCARASDRMTCSDVERRADQLDCHV